MMMVETELKPSLIQGLGVFITQPAKAGDVIWRFDTRVDRLYTVDELASLPAATQEFVRRYATWHEDFGFYMLCGDNGRFFNHSDAPSTISSSAPFGEDCAARDLPAGEELTSDYRMICDTAKGKSVVF